jgi:preprotein translocase subunit SecF
MITILVVVFSYFLFKWKKLQNFNMPLMILIIISCLSLNEIQLKEILTYSNLQIYKQA